MKTINAPLVPAGKLLNSKASMERLLSEQALGIVAGLRKSHLTLQAAEADLFNLENFQYAKKRRLSKDTLELLQYGMQLEDVVDIAPEGLEESYRAIENLAHKILANSLGKKLSPVSRLQAAGQ